MSDIVRLTNPNAEILQTIADGGLDVTMRVSTDEMRRAWTLLGQIMDNEPSERRRAWFDEGHSEQELRLLCGLFEAVAHALPMRSSNFIDWLRIFYPHAWDDFLVWRVEQLSDEILSNLLDFVLRDRDLEALGLERIEKPIRPARKRRGPSQAKMTRMAA